MAQINHKLRSEAVARIITLRFEMQRPERGGGTFLHSKHCCRMCKCSCRRIAAGSDLMGRLMADGKALSLSWFPLLGSYHAHTLPARRWRNLGGEKIWTICTDQVMQGGNWESSRKFTWQYPPWCSTLGSYLATNDKQKYSKSDTMFDSGHTGFSVEWHNFKQISPYHTDAEQGISRIHIKYPTLSICWSTWGSTACYLVARLYHFCIYLFCPTTRLTERQAGAMH